MTAGQNSLESAPSSISGVNDVMRTSISLESAIIGNSPKRNGDIIDQEKTFVCMVLPAVSCSFRAKGESGRLKLVGIGFDIFILRKKPVKGSPANPQEPGSFGFVSTGFVNGGHHGLFI